MLLLLQGTCKNVVHSINKINEVLNVEKCPNKPKGVVLWALPESKPSVNETIFYKIKERIEESEKIWVILRAIKRSSNEECKSYGPALIGVINEVLGEYHGCKYWPDEGEWRYFFTIEPVAVAKQPDQRLDEYVIRILGGAKPGSVIDVMSNVRGKSEEEIVQDLLRRINDAKEIWQVAKLSQPSPPIQPIRDDLDALSWILLVSGKNILFVGAPGVGKTMRALKLAEEAGSSKPIVITGRDGLTYNILVKGVRGAPGKLAQAVAESWNRLYEGERAVHIVFDEINRANTDLILGEMFTALDIKHRLSVGVISVNAARKAGINNKILDLLKQQLKDGVPLPLSFRIFATMNVVDRAQLFKLSFALLRRFAHIYVPPPWFNWDPVFKRGEVGGVPPVLNNYFNQAVEELRAKSVVATDLPTIVDVPVPKVEDVVRAHSHLLAFLWQTAVEAGEVGLELGVSVFVDVFKALAVYEGLKQIGAVELSIERLYDGLFSSLVAPQLAAVVPRLKFNYILGVGGEVSKFAKLMGGIEEVFGKNSLTSLVLQAIGAELPLEAR